MYSTLDLTSPPSVQCTWATFFLILYTVQYIRAHFSFFLYIVQYTWAQFSFLRYSTDEITSPSSCTVHLTSLLPHPVQYTWVHLSSSCTVYSTSEFVSPSSCTLYSTLDLTSPSSCTYSTRKFTSPFFCKVLLTSLLLPPVQYSWPHFSLLLYSTHDLSFSSFCTLYSARELNSPSSCTVHMSLVFLPSVQYTWAQFSFLLYTVQCTVHKSSAFLPHVQCTEQKSSFLLTTVHILYSVHISLLFMPHLHCTVCTHELSFPSFCTVHLNSDFLLPVQYTWT